MMTLDGTRRNRRSYATVGLPGAGRGSKKTAAGVTSVGDTPKPPDSEASPRAPRLRADGGMASYPPVHVIAVYSRDAATADFFKRALDSSGFAAFSGPADPAAFEAFVEAIQPAAVVFDVAASNESHWEELVRVSGRTPCRDIPMVITTGDRRLLPQAPEDAAIGLAPVVEMFTRSDDLRQLRQAVRQVVERSGSGPWRHSRAATRPS
jgi:hypothetical protein